MRPKSLLLASLVLAMAFAGCTGDAGQNTVGPAATAGPEDFVDPRAFLIEEDGEVADGETLDKRWTLPVPDLEFGRFFFELRVKPRDGDAAFSFKDYYVGFDHGNGTHGMDIHTGAHTGTASDLELWWVRNNGKYTSTGDWEVWLRAGPGSYGAYEFTASLTYPQ